MRRLKILIWHVHGSYLNALARLDHDWYVPVKPGRPTGYVGRGWTFDGHDRLHEVPASEVRHLDLDLVIHQTPATFFEDQFELLSPEQRRLPQIYLEHNTPKPDACNTRHPVDDPDVLLVHVTHFNELFWDAGGTRTAVVEHGIVPPASTYTGELPRVGVATNEPIRRGRVTGTDLMPRFASVVPLDVFGMGTTGLAAHLGVPVGAYDLAQAELHAELARRRAYLHLCRWTSLGLSLIEAMAMGMPVVVLASTEAVLAVPPA